jgi:hypothetical protein
MWVCMSQLHFYVPDSIEAQIRLKAKAANLPLSRFLADLVKREALGPDQWPEGYFDLFDQWDGEAQVRPSQPSLESRASFD